MKNVFDRMVSGNGKASEPAESSPRRSGTESAAETVGTSPDVKEVTQELLKYGYLEETRKPTLFQRAIVRERDIATALEPLDLAMKLDEHRGVAFLIVAEAACDPADEGSAWMHPLVRRQRLTLEQSLLIALLRQAFMMHEQESGVGQGPAKLAIDDLLPQYLTYVDDSGSDARNETRLRNLLDQLKTYGIVSEIDGNEEVTIRPMIAHIADPKSLQALVEALREQARGHDSSETGS